MTDDEFFADCEATFPGCAEHVERAVAEAPAFTPEQIVRGLALWATLPAVAPEAAADAA